MHEFNQVDVEAVSDRIVQKNIEEIQAILFDTLDGLIGEVSR